MFLLKVLKQKWEHFILCGTLNISFVCVTIMHWLENRYKKKQD